MEAVPVLRLHNISKRYGKVVIFDDASLTIGRGQSIAVVGPSGSGKTTLLQICGLIDREYFGRIDILSHTVLGVNGIKAQEGVDFGLGGPSAGSGTSVDVNSAETLSDSLSNRGFSNRGLSNRGFSNGACTAFRKFFGRRAKSGASSDELLQHLRRRIGFVFQFHYLLPEFSAFENVCISQMIAGNGIDKDYVQGLFEFMGVAHRAECFVGELSGGERQRVAIARALAHRPELVLADEPTGNLDPENAGIVFEVLSNATKRFGASLLLVTHNHFHARQMERVVEVKGGKVVCA